MKLSELIETYAKNIQTLDTSTVKTRIGMLGVLKQSWPAGTSQLVKDVRTSEIKAWLGNLSQIRKRELSKATRNEYIRMYFLNRCFTHKRENYRSYAQPLSDTTM